MLRGLITYFLLFSTLSVSLAPAFIVAGFELNRDYIATTLCINRDKPQLHCNGKCYLMKKLKAAEENERKENTRLKIETFSGYFNTKTFTTLKTQFFLVSDFKPVDSYINFYVNNVSGAIFKPPTAIS